jgi:predicted RNA-binding Zn-ribbon protein involved in translation (DUF1610 family)
MGPLILLFIVLMIWLISEKLDLLRENKRFNNGICPNCGEYLKLDKENSTQFQRVYTCPKCNHTARVSVSSNIDIRRCNVSDTFVWTVNCQNCKSKEYCQYNKKKTDSDPTAIK